MLCSGETLPLHNHGSHSEKPLGNTRNSTIYSSSLQERGLCFNLLSTAKFSLQMEKNRSDSRWSLSYALLTNQRGRKEELRRLVNKNSCPETVWELRGPGRPQRAHWHSSFDIGQSLFVATLIGHPDHAVCQTLGSVSH